MASGSVARGLTAPADALYRAGDDTLRGEDGNDVLSGGVGKAWLLSHGGKR